MLKDRNILLGVTGGVAAYKAVALASHLKRLAQGIQVVMTEGAQQLIQPRSFAAVTGAPVYTRLWDAPDNHRIDHVALADWADVVVIAPATANVLGKMAGGICDDLLSTLLCVCWEKPLLLAPAMNPRMWSHPRVQHNVATLVEMGIQFVGPEEGQVACGDTGVGRMAEPETILAALDILTED